MHHMGMGAEALKQAKRLNKLDHRLVLQQLVYGTNENCVMTFKTIAGLTAINGVRVRFLCRFLARKGWAEWCQAFDEDLMCCGSGYMATPLGKTIWEIRIALDEDEQKGAKGGRELHR